MAIPIVNKYRKDVKNLIQVYGKIRGTSVKASHDSSILDKTLQDSSYISPRLLRRLKLKKLASFMADSIVNENYSRGIVNGYLPFTDLHNLVRLHQEKLIRPPKNTLQAIYHLIDVSVSPTEESRYNLHRIAPGFMTHALNAVKELDMSSQFDTGYIDKLIKRAQEIKDEGVVKVFEKIKGEILLYNNADEIADSSSTQNIHD